MNSNTKAADALLKRKLLGASVESFGLFHQFLCIVFRDDTPEDHTLSIDTEIFSNNLDFNSSNLSNNEQALILFSRINLRKIIGIQCSDTGTLTINFDNGRNLAFRGQPADKTCTEPWQIGKGSPEEDPHHYLIIANHGGGYTIWDGNNSAT
ncbi:hypothetical protein [Hymenobacter convexus]|uniref:hypothetical protein n=1 Tax=Hymenobacter sp. CA1UV-4 TaxID=3063782 RepID=UPI002712F102|nr:hypothetical protein [Hymenobacter sp. CA1UV-4]MDO7852714.1 hypothetical protein [Hymenobacter sp. CA1UV-4]